MRRIRIYLDELLKAEAAKAKISKAALTRKALARSYGRRTSHEDDPLSRLIGTIDIEPAAVDEMVYRR